MTQDYVVVDLETTGLDIMNDEIIEIAAVKIRRGLIMDTFSALIDCHRPLSAEIVKLTGISNDMLAGQPDINEVLPQLQKFVGQAELVAHNASFDGEFLKKYWSDDRVWLDSIVLAQIAWPCLPSYSLANLCGELGIDNTQAHRALGDAMATAELFVKALKEFAILPYQAKEDILILAQQDETPTGELLRRACVLNGSGLSVGGEQKVTAAGKIKKRVANEDFVLDVAKMAKYIGPDSLFRERIPGFEERPQQLKMSLAVAKTLNESSCLLAEAGTGTGKSLAYLLPATLFAIGRGEPVAVSTHTRNLQEQLLNKDIPMLSELLGQEVNAVVAKGRNNYLCRRAYKYLLNNVAENMRYFMMRIASWRARSNSMDGGELLLTYYDKWKWQRISAVKENCAPLCPYGKSNSCIVQQTRASAGRADIIIINHSLLLANASLEKGFLPALPHLIIDEAQHLEHAAEDQLTSSIDFFSLLDLLGRLHRREKGKAGGTLALLRRRLNQLVIDGLVNQAEQLLNELEQSCEQTIIEAERFFGLLSTNFVAIAQKNGYFPARVRILPRHREEDSWQLVLDQGQIFGKELETLAKRSFRLLDLFDNKQNDNRAEQDEQKDYDRDELFSAANVARELQSTLNACLSNDDNFVAWVDFSDATKKPSLCIAPVELGELLNESLYSSTDSLVMTSATLSVGNNFNYFKQRLGLDLLPHPAEEMILPSPFFYHDQALFTIVDDLPDWSKCSEIEAVEAICGALINLLVASQGRAIILFTSHHQLKSVYNMIRQPLQEQGITLLAHGVSGDPSGLLDRLKKESRCCILGASSFWEGVDVIGEALSLIVVVRLPFWPPNTPLSAARMERIEAAGGSPFYDYSLPQALIRFKQGFGRLIRSESDNGVFCVLDRRLIEKSYGKKFIRCLPDIKCVAGNSIEVANAIRKWLD